MATHSSVLAWRIPGTGEPGGLPSMGSHRVRHDWSDLAAAAVSWGLIPFLKCSGQHSALWAGLDHLKQGSKFFLSGQCYQAWLHNLQAQDQKENVQKWLSTFTYFGKLCSIPLTLSFNVPTAIVSKCVPYENFRKTALGTGIWDMNYDPGLLGSVGNSHYNFIFKGMLFSFS